MKLHVICICVAVAVAGLLVDAPAKRSRAADGPLLARAEFVRVIAVGLRELAADYYWILTTHQIGYAQTAAEYRDIAAYADLAVQLDPKFLEVYRFGAINVPYNTGREHWVNTAESTALLRRALKVYPEDYRTQYLLANNLLFFERNYREAGLLLQKLSRYPNAPSYLARLATRVLAQGGDNATAFAFAQALRDTAQDDETREYFSRRMRQLEQEAFLQNVDQAARAFEQREGRRAHDLAELVARGDLAPATADPMGGRIFLDAEGRARSTAQWYRLEIYERSRKEAATRAQGDKEHFVPVVEP